MSDYEADDERFGTRRQRFLEDEMEGPLAEDWGMGDEAGRKAEYTTGIKKMTETTTTSSIKTTGKGTYALVARNTVLEISEVGIESTFSVEQHSSTAINLEFDTAPVIVALPVKDGLWRQKEGDMKPMEVSRESVPVPEARQFARNSSVMISVSRTVCDTGKEVLVNNGNAAEYRLQTNRDKPPEQETHQSTSTNLIIEAAPTISPESMKGKVVKDTDVCAAHAQQVTSRRLTTTSEISHTTSAHESTMKAPGVPSKALGKSKSGTASSRTPSAQEFTMKAPAVPLKAHGSLASTAAFARTTSAQELTMNAPAVLSRDQGGPTSSTAFSRTTSAQELPMRAPRTTSPIRGKGKEKALSLPVPAHPTVDQPRPSTSTSRKANSLPRTKIPPTLQLIHENFTNFEMAVGAAQPGAKVRFRKGKGMFAMDKLDLSRQSEVFKDCVVVVAHHISAKADQLVPRWAQVSGFDQLCRDVS